MDIDDFKTYNDLNGHLLGDIALIKIGRLLKENTRSSDVPARYGGDEFAAMLTEIGAREAFLRANRLRHLVTLSPFQYEKNMPGKKLTISAGVALFPDHGANHIELLKNADKALYQAKNEGRNRICVCRN
jgi:diguanylate cyclase (GGDEF)-like protein